MLKWAIIAAVIAVIAGAFGFGLIASAAASIAKVLFFIFLAVFLVLLISGIVVGRKVKAGLTRHDHH
ncbi:DUF1328 family protein [Opitutus terrae]|uniref:Uncharacterized protein n=1 Tax=Opitutus terrae (strain DSM 11246 / JCM 15787 / PB90-1) TaxID=452637 RepID=B1ZSM4_OPITP|nr:DUF1328 family protein [Opitutus terrae]ACB73881.1 protein of unknown function DUF1328 [Opitutus terrae PB90-1]